MFASAAELRRSAIRLAAVAALSAAVIEGCAARHATLRPPAVAIDDPSFVRTLAAHVEAPFVAGNRVEPLFNGEEIFPAVLAAIRGARTSITYAQYYWDDGPIGRVIAEALAERRRSGVDVKVLLDAFGSLGMPEAHARTLQDAGCDLVVFRPLAATPPLELNHRQHGRILVVDGRIGFAGGSGIGHEWRGAGIDDGQWRETDVRLEGPIVAMLQAAFVRLWREATGTLLGGDRHFPALRAAGDVPAQVVDSAPWRGDRSVYDLFFLSFAGARRSILITNPYFLPDDTLRDTLLAAARRGVRVALLLPGAIDHALLQRLSRSEFGPLLEAGIEVYEYRPARLHAKTVVVDGALAIIGSANLDPRSLMINAEVDVVVHSAAVAQRLERAFAEDVRRSTPVSRSAWRRRPLPQRLLEWLLRPLRSQL